MGRASRATAPGRSAARVPACRETLVASVGVSDDRDAGRFHTTAPTPPPATAGARASRLVVLYAPDDRDIGASRVLGSEPVSLGRAPAGEGALVLYDDEASRLHAVISREDDDTFVVEDRGSRNGTFVDGARVTRAPLRDGAVLRLGSHVLHFETLGRRSRRSSARARARAR
jgi:pSer/pThr/pTyr-binding forkhead associated (FHA) protein